uniref:Adaptor related protein complex 3 subunit sigma 1 n=1 Tax=Zosterops lateralis melanops TaxID=1220523 RepID=A0A8D2QPK5_ZOSLA
PCASGFQESRGCFTGICCSGAPKAQGEGGILSRGRLGTPSCVWKRCSRLCSPAVQQSEDTQQQIIRETFHLVSKRDENVCNFLEGGLLIGGSDNKLIYRHYATLYFVFCVDSSESELGILDLIQVFVETLDKCFENVCELDLIFHVDKVHNILAEMVMGGMVLETNMNEIVTQIDAQNKLEKSEAGLAGAPARAVSAVKNMNLPEIPRNINIGDISIKVPNLPTFK